MAEQLIFDLPARPALGRGDFFVSAANRLAAAAIEGWRDWPGRKLVLTGPEASGKTHLARVWAAESGARIVVAAELGMADVSALAGGPVAVEDADRVTGHPAEQALFHLHNLVLETGGHLLLTSVAPPARWGICLPDLVSRLHGTTLVQLQPPDDALLAAVLVKLFSDRQLAVEPATIDYIVRRIDRSFAAAGQIVEALDAASLSQRRAINRPLAAALLDKTGSGNDTCK